MSNDNSDFPKLSPTEFVILEMLIAKGEMFGLEMAEASNGELKRGAIYVFLSRMSDKGYIDSREVPRIAPEIGIPRRQYWATGFGERVFQANTKALEVFNSGLAWGGI